MSTLLFTSVSPSLTLISWNDWGLSEDKNSFHSIECSLHVKLVEHVISFNLHNLVLPLPPFSKIRRLRRRETKQLAQVQLPLTPKPLTPVRSAPGCRHGQRGLASVSESSRFWSLLSPHLSPSTCHLDGMPFPRASLRKSYSIPTSSLSYVLLW